jgi:bifunctional non-homologous end joining protein LigD
MMSRRRVHPSRAFPAGADLIREIKHDGHRMMGAGVRLFTRRGFDWTDRFPAIANAARALRAVIPHRRWEAVYCDESGVSVFQMLRQRRNGPRVFLYAFDLMHLDGRDLRREPPRGCVTVVPDLVVCGPKWY